MRTGTSSLTNVYCTAVLMADPNWKRGFYYDDLPPHTGMKLARRESRPFFSPVPLPRRASPLLPEISDVHDGCYA